MSVSKCGVCECRDEPPGCVCVLGPSPASLIPARHIKETGDDGAARCLYLVLPASSTLWWGKVGQSRVLLTIFGRVLCPPQPSCLPPLLAARAPLLRSPLLACRLSLFSTISPPLLFLPLFHHPMRTLLNPLLVSMLPLPSYHPVPPSIIYPVLPVNVFVFSSPNPLLQLILFLPALLLPLYFLWL